MNLVAGSIKGQESQVVLVIDGEDGQRDASDQQGNSTRDTVEPITARQLAASPMASTEQEGVDEQHDHGQHDEIEHAGE